MLNHTTYVAKEGGYIICELNGGIDRAGTQVFIKSIFELGSQTGISLIVVDARNARNAMGPFENHFVMYKDMQSAVKKQQSSTSKLKIAVLVDPEDKSHDFVETLAYNAGYRFKLFQDEQAALTWLHAD